MSDITDPARELVDLCAKLKGGGKTNGAEFLAKKFGVPAWSAEFYQIVFMISKRINDLVEIVARLKMDDDFKSEAISHLKAIQHAFSQNGLNNNWGNAEEHFLSPANIQPMKMLSARVREVISYPKLSDEEVTQLTVEVGQLKDWLTDHQLAEQDFIRQALLDGVTQLQFRLERLGWLGWGYALESLRDVITAYAVLEKGAPDPVASPDAAVILKKTREVVISVFKAAKISKEVYETGDFLLRAYGAAALITQGVQAVSGILPHLP